MSDIALTVLALLGGGLAVEVFSAALAPLGYQDEHGFHLGAEPQQHGGDRLGEKSN